MIIYPVSRNFLPNGSTGGSVDRSILKQLGVNSKLTKLGDGKQGAQLRIGFWWALKRGYEGIITIDGNNKDSIESVPLFIQKLDQGYDFIQGSRFVKGGKAVHTPLIRYISVRLIHAPIISLTAGHWFTDTANAFRGYSRYYLILLIMTFLGALGSFFLKKHREPLDNGSAWSAPLPFIWFEYLYVKILRIFRRPAPLHLSPISGRSCSPIISWKSV